ncbi:PREDICTED: tetratricopeptide repeat protein 29-like, partial [Tinamus guttatus]|uniref:tetratricopeptide repeat protein 29-like n=1 Tax=Tinamus guttatus TaxID=94827 RepID=UPI00052EF4C1
MLRLDWTSSTLSGTETSLKIVGQQRAANGSSTSLFRVLPSEAARSARAEPLGQGPGRPRRSRRHAARDALRPRHLCLVPLTCSNEENRVNAPDKMNILPPLIVQRPRGHPTFIEQTVCPALEFARVHLIKDKDGIDDYLAKNIKGLSKQEAAACRNSYKKNICIDMLRQGYHKSFSELFALIQKWNALREAAGPGSAIWQQPSLEEQPDKLDQLYHFLTRAEAAQRAGNYEEVYNNQLNLAYCFNDSEDKWLRNYFYEQCFNTAQLIKIDGGKKEAQAHANMGLISEEQGDIMKAAEHYEAFYELTLGSTWKDETGRTYNSLACEHLWKTYTVLADKMLEDKQHQQVIKTLKKAFKMAKE